MGSIVPAGMPPGAAYITEERAPEGVLYFRIYGGIFAFFHGALAIGGAALLLAPFFSSSLRSSSSIPSFWFAGILYGGMGIVFLTPTMIALFGGRRPWVHTLGTVVIALGMLNLCCIPVLIPLLIVWMKPETRRWFGAT